MIIVPVKEGENIERALKKFKKKFERTRVLKQLRARQHFTKPSVQKRDVKIRAIFREKLKSEEN
jgi:small subunit ribosomal protein S21